MTDKNGTRLPGKQKTRGFITRIEKVNEEIAALKEDIKTIKLEASDAGVSTRALNAVLGKRKKMGKMSPDEWADYCAELEALEETIGEDFMMTPLGQAATDAAEGAAAIH